MIVKISAHCLTIIYKSFIQIKKITNRGMRFENICTKTTIDLVKQNAH